MATTGAAGFRSSPKVRYAQPDKNVAKTKKWFEGTKDQRKAG
jgi:hypothetical protein